MLIRKELLPTIKEKQGWTITECHEKNTKMGQQPVGATGTPLGAISLVRLQGQLMKQELRKKFPVLCLLQTSQSGVESCTTVD